jgi:hypothetical protein
VDDEGFSDACDGVYWFDGWMVRFFWEREV